MTNTIISTNLAPASISKHPPLFLADCNVCACSVSVNLPYDEIKIAKLLLWKKVGSLPKVTLPLMRVTLHPGLPCSPSQLCNFSYERFAAIYKGTYEKLSRPGLLGMEGNPLTRDNSPQYKQALSFEVASKTGFQDTQLVRLI